MRGKSCNFPKADTDIPLRSYKIKQENKNYIFKGLESFFLSVVVTLRACLNTSKQNHLCYSKKTAMHYAIFWVSKSHIACITQQTGGTVQVYRVASLRLLLPLLSEILTRLLVIVVLVLDVVYG